MISVFVWAAVVAVMGLRFRRRRWYRVFVMLLLATAATIGLSWSVLSQSFAGKRLEEGMSSLGSSDGFIQLQHRKIVQSMDQWFPFGFGPGRGNRIDPTDPEHHEVHNGLLAVLVELGVLGFVGFSAMVLRPLFRRPPAPRGDGALALRATLITSFILVSVVFMFHNTLFRDRTYMLFLGMATAIARKPGAAPLRELEAIP
jgi:hypothetical protein